MPDIRDVLAHMTALGVTPHDTLAAHEELLASGLLRLNQDGNGYEAAFPPCLSAEPPADGLALDTWVAEQAALLDAHVLAMRKRGRCARCEQPR